jgi:hypothetical protein
MSGGWAALDGVRCDRGGGPRLAGAGEMTGGTGERDIPGGEGGGVVVLRGGEDGPAPGVERAASAASSCRRSFFGRTNRRLIAGTLEGDPSGSSLSFHFERFLGPSAGEGDLVERSIVGQGCPLDKGWK